MKMIDSAHLEEDLDTKNCRVKPKYILNLANKLKKYSPGYHNPALVNEAKKHFKFVEESLTEDNQRTIYKKFEEEFENRKKNNDITYEWWQILNFRFSILITPEKLRSNYNNDPDKDDKTLKSLIENEYWHEHSQFVDFCNTQDVKSSFGLIYQFMFYVKDFDNFMMLPITYGGELTEYEFNKCLKKNIHLIGLSKIATIADGRVWQPDRFYRHDIIHMLNYSRVINSMGNTIATEMFIGFILKKIDKSEILNLRQKAQLNIILFQMTHEIPDILNTLIKKDKEICSEQLFKPKNRTFKDVILETKTTEYSDTKSYTFIDSYLAEEWHGLSMTKNFKRKI